MWAGGVESLQADRVALEASRCPEFGTCLVVGKHIKRDTGRCKAQSMTIESATDTLVFREYVRHFLVPGLRRGDTVIMDNLTPHKSAQMLALIEAAGAEVRFLPAYSPDLNPIEKRWSKVKAGLRAAEARTLPELERAIDATLQTIAAQNAAGWFTSCGYNSK